LLGALLFVALMPIVADTTAPKPAAAADSRSIPTMQDRWTLVDIPARPTLGVFTGSSDPRFTRWLIKNPNDTESQLHNMTSGAFPGLSPRKATAGQWDTDEGEEVLVLGAAGDVVLLDDASQGFKMLDFLPSSAGPFTAAGFADVITTAGQKAEQEILLTTQTILNVLPSHANAGSFGGLHAPHITQRTNVFKGNGQAVGAAETTLDIRGVGTHPGWVALTNYDPGTQVAVLFIIEDITQTVPNAQSDTLMAAPPAQDPLSDAKSVMTWKESTSPGIGDGTFAVLTAPTSSTALSWFSTGTMRTTLIAGNPSLSANANQALSTACHTSPVAVLEPWIRAGESAPSALFCPTPAPDSSHIAFAEMLGRASPVVIAVRGTATGVARLAVADQPANADPQWNHEVHLMATVPVHDGALDMLVETGATLTPNDIPGGTGAVYTVASTRPPLQERPISTTYAPSQGNVALNVALGKVTITLERDLVTDHNCTEVSPGLREVCNQAHTDGNPVAVMAAPPNVHGLGQEFVPSTFVTGKSKGDSSEISEHTDIHVGAGGEWQDEITQSGFSFEVSLDESAGYSTETSTNQTVDDLYFGFYDKNTVIYTDTSMWQATYKIASSTDGLDVGEPYIVVLPRATVLTEASQDEYLRKFPTGPRKADFDALLPNPNDLHSYPAMDISDEPDLSSKGCTNDDPLVGALHAVNMLGPGAGAESTSVRIAESNAETVNYELTLGVEFQIRAAGLTGSFGVSQTVGQGITTTLGTDTGADGYVGHIPYLENDLDKNESYNWRMYFCKATLAGQDVWVVNYMVANYQGRGEYLSPAAETVAPSGYADRKTTDELRWASEGTLRDHSVEIEAVGEPSSIEPISAGVNGADPGTSTEHAVTPTGLVSGTTYRWRVNANAYTGDVATTDWSYFRAWAAPAAPSLYTPLVNADRSLDLEWLPGANSKNGSYNVVVSSDAAGTSVEDSVTGTTATRWRTKTLPYGQHFVKVTPTNPKFTGTPATTSITTSAVVPVARFDIDRPLATRLDTVHFTDTSFDRDGTIASRLWDFGDGTTSTATNPSHKFTTLGDHNVKLTVTDNENASASFTGIVRVSNIAPTASIAGATPDPSTRLQDVQFTSGGTDSDGTITSRLWDFDDGTTSAAVNPKHRYTTIGTHEVSLTTTDNDGGHATATRIVTVNNVAPTGGFTSTPSTVFTNDEVSFFSTASDSDGGVMRVHWDFGDGTNVDGFQPTHRYADNGVYMVTSTAYDADGGATPTSKFINVRNRAPVSQFNFTPSSPTDLDTVVFTSTASDPDGQVAGQHWDFGDGQSSSAANPGHKYADNGTYNVTLTATDDDGAVNAVTHSVTVRNVAPTAKFTWTNSSPNTASNTNFVDGSTDPDGKITRWLWKFGDGASSTVRNPSHRYRACGNYTVTLTVTDNDAATGALAKPISVARALSLRC
jgi:PKD repeat protein